MERTRPFGSRKKEKAMTEDNLLPALPIPHCPVMLILDTSHSMWGQGMLDQQDALRAFQKTLHAHEFTDSRIEIAAVGMGDDLRVLQPFTPLAESAVGTMTIRPKGNTPIGGALRLALDELSRWTEELRRRGEGIATPQLLLLSDGKSSDDFSAEAAAIRKAVDEGRLACRAVALGERPDLASLAQFAGAAVDCPDYGRLRETFTHIGEAVSKTYEETVPDILVPSNDSKKSGWPESDPPTARRLGGGHLSGRVILVDGTNVCFWNGKNKAASLTPVLALAKALDAERADWQMCFDASTRHHLAKQRRGDDAAYEELLRARPERFAEAPAGIRADIFLLEAADADGRALIITQDRYRDHEARYPFVRDAKRVYRGGVFHGQLCVPDLGIRCAVESSASNH